MREFQFHSDVFFRNRRGYSLFDFTRFDFTDFDFTDFDFTDLDVTEEDSTAFDEEYFSDLDEEYFPEDDSTEIKSTTEGDSTEIKSTTEGDSTEIKSTTEGDSTEIKSTTEKGSTKEDFTEIESTTEKGSTDLDVTEEDLSRDEFYFYDSDEEDEDLAKFAEILLRKVKSTNERGSAEIESTTEKGSTEEDEDVVKIIDRVVRKMLSSIEEASAKIKSTTEKGSTKEDVTEIESTTEKGSTKEDVTEIESTTEKGSTKKDVTEEDSFDEDYFSDLDEEDEDVAKFAELILRKVKSTNERGSAEIESTTEKGSTEEDLIRDEFYHPLFTTEDGLYDPRFSENPSFDEDSFPEDGFPEDDFPEGDSTEVKSTTEGDSTEIESITEGDFTEIESTTEEDFTEIESTTEEDSTPSYKHLWVLCEDCYTLNYKRFLKERLYICEGCESHLKMNSSERLELLVDLNTWDPMNEKIASTDPIQWDSEEPLIGLDSESGGGPVVLYLGEIPFATVPEEVPFELDIKDDPYIDRIDSYQKKTGLTEAIQTGIGQLNGIPIAMGVMEFGFMGGSMGSAVGEKITRLIEYATTQCLPLIIVCASGGARMQEGSLSLMQMAKISSALYHFQIIQKFLYFSILTSPTTGGVTASFGMLGDMIVAEPNAYIAFAGKRVIEQTLNKEVPEGSQETEYLFDKGLFDQVVPRKTLKSVLNEVFDFHSFFPLNQNSIESNRTFSFII
nr:acetyl-CoA carboxylase beta subunit [Dipsacus japonicus]